MWLLSNISSTFVMHNHLYLSCDICMFILSLVCLPLALACVSGLYCVNGCLALYALYVSLTCYVNVLDACIPLVSHSCARCELLCVTLSLLGVCVIFKVVLPVRVIFSSSSSYSICVAFSCSASPSCYVLYTEAVTSCFSRVLRVSFSPAYYVPFIPRALCRILALNVARLFPRLMWSFF